MHTTRGLLELRQSTPRITKMHNLVVQVTVCVCVDVKWIPSYISVLLIIGQVLTKCKSLRVHTFVSWTGDGGKIRATFSEKLKLE